MKKLNLDINALEVESFETSRLSNWEGTVHGNDATEGGDTKCGGIQTCGDGGQLTAGGDTKCGGIQTCGEGCLPTAGGATHCGGIHTCPAGCKA